MDLISTIKADYSHQKHRHGEEWMKGFYMNSAIKHNFNGIHA
jgi:hypothetical protein